MPRDVVDILLCQRFLPERGGSIRWMHEVYRRWPRPVRVITHDYVNHPPGTPETADIAAPPNGVDHVTDANLIMDRRDIFMDNWGLDRFDRVRRYRRMAKAVREQLRDPANRDRTVVVHCIHAVPEAASLIPLMWRHRKRVRIVSYAHGEEITACCSSRQLTFLMRRAHRVVDLMIANSQNTKRLLTGHIDISKVQVVHPGVEVTQFAGATEAGLRWRAEHGLDGKQVVLTVGRLDRRKNHRAVIDAVAELAPRYSDLVYVVVGQGGQGDALGQQAAERGVADRVRFTGSLGGDELVSAYGACDVFAMPAVRDGTDVEGFGMVFVEAGACGKPVIAGREGGQPEAVTDGESGWVVDGTDGSAVTSALDRLLADADLRKRMGEAGLERARGLDWSAVVQRTVQLVDNLTGH